MLILTCYGVGNILQLHPGSVINECTFQHNFAENDAGAILVAEGNIWVDISNSLLKRVHELSNTTWNSWAFCV